MKFKRVVASLVLVCSLMTAFVGLSATSVQFAGGCPDPKNCTDPRLAYDAPEQTPEASDGTIQLVGGCPDPKNCTDPKLV